MFKNDQEIKTMKNSNENVSASNGSSKPGDREPIKPFKIGTMGAFIRNYVEAHIGVITWPNRTMGRVGSLVQEAFEAWEKKQNPKQMLIVKKDGSSKVRPRVIVVVRGGLVQGACGSEDIDLEVLDHDNWSSCGDNNEEAQNYQKLDDECKELIDIY